MNILGIPADSAAPPPGSSPMAQGYIPVGHGIHAGVIMESRGADRIQMPRIGLLIDRHIAGGGPRTGDHQRYIGVMLRADLESHPTVCRGDTAMDVCGQMGPMGSASSSMIDITPRMLSNLHQRRSGIADVMSGALGRDRNAWSPQSMYELDVGLAMANPNVYRKTHAALRTSLGHDMHGNVPPPGHRGLLVVGVSEFSEDRRQLMRDTVRLGHIRELRTLSPGDTQVLQSMFAQDRDVRPNIITRQLSVYNAPQLRQLSGLVEDGQIAVWGPKGDGALKMMDIIDQAQRPLSRSAEVVRFPAGRTYGGSR